MKWGIMATGSIARTFASTVQGMRAEGETLAAVGSRRAESARAFAAEYGIGKYYGSYEALVADPDVDAVYIATPNSLHYENSRLCLLHGKHVLCEKPFTLRPGEARALYALAAEKGLFIMEAFWIWLLPLYRDFRRLLADGGIGTVRRIRCQYGFVAEGARRERKFNSALGGGALLDIGIYNLGLIQMIQNQRPESFESDVHINEYGTDGDSRLVLRYAGGCVAECVQAIGRTLDRKAEIIGTKGRVTLADFEFAESMVFEPDGGAKRELRYPFDISGYEYEIREVSRCVGAGKSFSDVYTPDDSVNLAALLYDIRMDWGMKFVGE